MNPFLNLRKLNIINLIPFSFMSFLLILTSCNPIIFESPDAMKESKKQTKANKKGEKSYDKAYKSGDKYCKKLYKWLYNEKIGNEKMGYQILIGESLSSEDYAEDTMYQLKPLLNNRTYLLAEFSLNSQPDLCNFHNIIPAQLADDIKNKKAIYRYNIDEKDFYSQEVKFDETYFRKNIEPYIKDKDMIYNGEAAEDCGCGMGEFTKADYKERKSDYKIKK